MRAEGIHAHGYHAHACQMAVDLAKQMLKNPPNLGADLMGQPGGSSMVGPIVSKGKKKKVNPASHVYTTKASQTLAHCAFLCTVLSEHPDHTHLAFQIGMFGLEMARLPASTKPMEVKLAHQESELVSLLKRIPLGPRELNVLRERATQLQKGTLRSRGDSLLPLMLSSYIFESLMLATTHHHLIGTGLCQQPPNNTTNAATDEELGFEAAVAALGLKSNVSEADHPLLCEGTRRQRGDLALLLLVHYKDQPEKLAKIMEKILDKEVHQLFKAQILPNYYVANTVGGSGGGNANQQANINNRLGNNFRAVGQGNGVAARMAVLNRQMENLDLDDNANQVLYANDLDELQRHQRRAVAEGRGVVVERMVRGGANGGPGSDSGSSGNSTGESFDSSSSSSRLQNAPYAHVLHRMAHHHHHHPGVVPQNLAARLQNPNLVSTSGGAAALPPCYAQQQPSDIPPRNNVYPSEHVSPDISSNGGVSHVLPQPHLPPTVNEMSNLVRTTLPNIKMNSRYKGKRAYPSLPNQPSEALAHFMFELAKQVLTKAGGNSSTSLFTQPSTNPNNPQRGPHRALHMCAFQLGLYALGLHNRVSPNWLSRTYSSHVSWIIGQAMEIGASAICFLKETWQAHLTPPEAAGLADKASKTRAPPMVRAAADLALSVLPQAAALNQNEIQRAIQQCKEQSYAMLEKACQAVEKAANNGSINPEVMFEVGRHWYYLYEKHLPNTNRVQGQNQQMGNPRMAAGGIHPMGPHPHPPNPFMQRPLAAGSDNPQGRGDSMAVQAAVGGGDALVNRPGNNGLISANPAVAAALAQFAGASAATGGGNNGAFPAAMAAAVGHLPPLPPHGASGAQVNCILL